MTRTRVRGGTISVEVDVDVADIVDDISDEDIKAIYEERHLDQGKVPVLSSADRLTQAIEDRHASEHTGPLVLCRDEICDLMVRAA